MAAAGATLVLLTVALPHSSHTNDLALLLIVANAYAIAAILYWRASLLPSRVVQLSLGWGSTLIAGIAAYGVLLIARAPASDIAVWWLVGMGTLLVAAIMVRAMRERGELLVRKLRVVAALLAVLARDGKQVEMAFARS